MKNLHLFLWMGLALVANTMMAAPRYSAGQLSHWLGISATGVEANHIFKKNLPAYTQAGGGGEATLLYEIQKGRFFFNIGLGAEYMQTASAIDAYSDEFLRMDYTGDQVLYRYVYSDYEETQTQLRVVAPVHFGYHFGDWFYIGLGAAFRSKPLMNAFDVKTRILTEGQYDYLIQPIRNAPDYGYWQEADYTGKGVVNSATHEMAVQLELGARVPIAKKVQMRVGAFLGYDLPLISYKQPKDILVNYAAVDTNPLTQSMENLAQNIQFNSMLDANVTHNNLQRIRVGVKLTFIFNVTNTAMPCMCLID